MNHLPFIQHTNLHVKINVQTYTSASDVKVTDKKQRSNILIWSANNSFNLKYLFLTDCALTQTHMGKLFKHITEQ